MARTIPNKPGSDHRLPCLTLRKPWAALVVEGIKRYEDRGFRPGDWLLGREFVIHAGKTSDVSTEEIEKSATLKGLRLLEAEGLVGIVTLKGWIDVREGRLGGYIHLRGDEVRRVTESDIRRARLSPWTEEGAVWWILDDAQAAIPFRGRPGLFRLEDDVEESLRKAIR